MIEAEVATTIRRPRRDVAAVMLCPEYEPEWIGGVLLVRRLDDGPLQGGARFERTSRGAWGRSVGELVVAKYVPDRILELTGQSPRRHRLRYTLEGIPEGTIARIEVSRSTGAGLHVPAAIGAAMLRRAIIADLDRLKELVEAGGGRGASGVLKPVVRPV